MIFLSLSGRPIVIAKLVMNMYIAGWKREGSKLNRIQKQLEGFTFTSRSLLNLFHNAQVGCEVTEHADFISVLLLM